MTNNILLHADVYKWGHMEQYKEGTEFVYSYLTARSTKKYGEIMMFGFQYYATEYLCKPITKEHVQEFVEAYEDILGPCPESTKQKVQSLQKLGYLPIKIKAVPEGTIVPVKCAVSDKTNVLLTMTNTLPGFGWVVGLLEGLLLKLWYTCSVASYSRNLCNLVRDFAAVTCDNFDHLKWSVHDFGYRGVSSEETAELGGAAHLINFYGSDTIVARGFIKKYYPTTTGHFKQPIMQSVPATEHSVMCSYGLDGEFEAFEKLLETYPTGILSIVSDTYNLWNVLTNFLPRLKDKILARDGKVVIRPDSGDPEKIILGDKDATPGSPEYKGALELLAEVFGTTLNSKGFKVLNPKIGLIYGDGFYWDRFVRVLNGMKSAGWATSNLVVGIGGLLLQQHNRDDGGFAFKAIQAIINGKPVALFKDPVTDPGKKSHTGLLSLHKRAGGHGVYWETKENVTVEQEQIGELKVVFIDGSLTRISFDEVRDNVERSFVYA